MANSYTTNLNLTKPEVGADTDAWGGHLNTDLDTLDAIFKSDGTGTAVGINAPVHGSATTIALKTNGTTTAMFIDASQNVGIGTTSPISKLNVNGGVISALDGRSIGDYQFLAEGGYGGYSGAISFQSRTSSGGTLVEMARISADGESSWNTTTSTQDAYLRFLTAQDGTSTERMRIDSSGNVGIGTTTTYGFKQAINAGSSTSGQLVFGSGTGVYTNWSDGTATNSPAIGGIGNNLVFATGASSNSERMRLDSSGNLLVGTTSNGPYTTRLTLQYAGTTRWSVGPTSSTDTFYISSSSSSTGVYLTASGTSWTSNSDENLKNITGTIQNGLEKIATLRAAEFTWKADATNKPQVGLIAQDVQKVLPEVIDTNDDGHLGVRYTEVIPLLVAALQEAVAKIDVLETRIATLEKK
jgi:hypothetical protein